ncbi:hypothetical protein CROQUDRAFT_656159 [Cronartium quercuum f. sp. fusiforme G11]|uniref:Uncharacterized protein n=1 Tax=Cronartium quercuum f. sp. fusiforme G11 TaxID=708437 RepID=A0A9P6NPW3_9BASI|nr:hypothetical protein CROQUDRAFT_656159 [Cronartium quercuum f. sp. fusiforme G11]
MCCGPEAGPTQGMTVALTRLQLKGQRTWRFHIIPSCDPLTRIRRIIASRIGLCAIDHSIV